MSLDSWHLYWILSLFFNPFFHRFCLSFICYVTLYSWHRYLIPSLFSCYAFPSIFFLSLFVMPILILVVLIYFPFFDRFVLSLFVMSLLIFDSFILFIFLFSSGSVFSTVRVYHLYSPLYFIHFWSILFYLYCLCYS